VAAVATLVRSAALAPTAAGGVLPSTMRATPGTGTWSTAAATCSGTTTTRAEWVLSALR